MTRHRKATKADNKSRKKHDRWPEMIHRGQSTADSDGSPGRDDDRGALAVGDAEQLLRRPPKRRTTPSGPPLGDNVETAAD